ncbi:hypothetical protein ACFL3H_03305, partial [Gemmatimonadota bacterium]
MHSKWYGSRRTRIGSSQILLAAVLLFILPLSSSRAQVTAPPGMRTLTLEESIVIALEDSRSVQDARYALAVANKQVIEARGLAMPTLSANANFTRSLTPLESFLPAIILDPTASPDDFIAVRFGADNSW